MTHSPSAHAARPPLPLWVRGSLGGLWLLDTVLQAQPGMFTMAMLSGIMQPAAQGQPPWLAAAMAWANNIIGAHLIPLNVSFVAVQGLIAVCILLPRAGWNRTGLWLSIAWSTAVWVFGEGMGQVLTGAATPIGGAPGAVVLYGAIAALLLAGWGRGRPRALPWTHELAIGLFAAGAVAQAAPLYWTPLGLSTIFQGMLAMQPHWLAGTLAPVVAVTFAHPAICNAILVAATAAVAVGLWRRATWGYALAAAWLLFTWWAGEAFGMMLTGMGTDPNSVPLLALLIAAGVRPPAPRAHAATHPVAAHGATA